MARKHLANFQSQPRGTRNPQDKANLLTVYPKALALPGNRQMTSGCMIDNSRSLHDRIAHDRGFASY